MLDLLLRVNPSLHIENEPSLEHDDKIKLLALAWRINEQRFYNTCFIEE